MSFLSKALKRAEVFLEQVDESVAQASRRMVVEDAVADVDDHAWAPMADDPAAIGIVNPQATPPSSLEVPAVPPARRRGVANIPRADERMKENEPIPRGQAQTTTQSKPSSSGQTFDSSDSRVAIKESEHAWNDGVKRDVNLLEHTDLKPASQSRTSENKVTLPSAPLATEGEVPDCARYVTGTSEVKSTNGIAHDDDSVAQALEEQAIPALTNQQRWDSSVGKDAVSDSVGLRSLQNATRKDERHGLAQENTDLASADEEYTSSEIQEHALREETFESSDEQTRSKNNALVRGESTEDIAPEYDDVSVLREENAELRKELELAEEDFESIMKDRARQANKLQRMKQVISDVDESLQQKSETVRRLESELIDVKDQLVATKRKAEQAATKERDEFVAARKTYEAEKMQLQSDVDRLRHECEIFRSENAKIKDASRKGQEVDMATADDARQLATRAQAAYEQEVAAHRETRDILKAKQEAAETDAALAGQALASAERRAEEAHAALAVAKSAQRQAESKLNQVSAARDVALARINDLMETVSSYEASSSGQHPGSEELLSLHQTVSELENALQAKNVELTRLEGDVENMRRALRARQDLATSHSGAEDSQTARTAEVEQKLRHMADSALRKQAQIEIMRAENKALQHQLETERKRTREAQAMAAAATSSRQALRGGFRGFVSVDEESGDRSYGVREGPVARFRAPRTWPKPVIRVLVSLDSVSANALGFLRREPVVRMMLVVYVFAVHVLIYFVLHFHIENTGSFPDQTLTSKHYKSVQK